MDLSVVGAADEVAASVSVSDGDTTDLAASVEEVVSASATEEVPEEPEVVVSATFEVDGCTNEVELAEDDELVSATSEAATGLLVVTSDDPAELAKFGELVAVGLEVSASAVGVAASEDATTDLAGDDTSLDAGVVASAVEGVLVEDDP